MKRLLILCISAILLLSGCSGLSFLPSKERTVTCTINIEDDVLPMQDTIILGSKNDNLATFVDTNVVNLSNFDEAAHQEILDEILSGYGENASGIEISGRLEATSAIISINIDLAKASPEDLVRIGLAETADSNNFSLDATVNGLETNGYTCK